MKNKLEMLSELTGSGKSTVSKAIRHCFGVDPLTREQILMTARQVGVRSDDRYDCYLIFPDRPIGFWTRIVEQFCYECAGLRVKYNVYPPDSAYVLSDYLVEAKNCGAGIILCCARPDERQYELLSDAARHTPIIFLFDRVDIVNTFVIGSDAYADGKAVRKRASLKENARVLILHDGSCLSLERVRGFTGNGGTDAVCITLPESSTAAEIARAVSSAKIARCDAVYTASHQIRETALAALKLGFGKDCAVLGHDYAEAAFVHGEVNGIHTLALCPDAEGICRAASDALIKYTHTRNLPDRKHTVIPSER